jgi:WD40 repeat protein
MSRLAGAAAAVPAPPPAQPHPELVAQQSASANGSPALAFPQNGMWLASGNQIWDMRSRRVLRILPVRRSLSSVTFSADGALEAGIENGGSAVTVWDPHEGVPLASLTVPGANPTCLAFLGDRLIAGYSDGAVRLWDARAGRVLLKRPTGFASVGAIAGGAQGRFAAAVSGGGTLSGRVALLELNAAGGGSRSLTATGDAAFQDVAVSPSGDRIAAGGMDGLTVWDAASGRILATFPHSGQVLFTADGQILLNLRNSYGSLDGREATLGQCIDWLDPDTCQRRHTVVEGYGMVRMAADPTGRYLAASSFDAITLFDQTTGVDLGGLTGSGALTARLAFSHSGILLATATGRYVNLWAIDQVRSVLKVAVRAETWDTTPIRSLFFAPGDDVIYATTGDGVQGWRIRDGQPLPLLRKGSDAPLNSPGGYSAYYDDGLAGAGAPVVYGLRTLIRQTPQAALECGKIDVWDSASGQRRTTFGDADWRIAPGPTDFHDFMAAAVRGDGARLATARLKERTVQLWDPQTGAIVRTIDTGGPDAVALAYAPAGDLLAIGCANGVVQIWTDDGTRPAGVLSGHTEGVAAIRFLPDGSGLIAGSDDGHADLWQIPSGSRSWSIDLQSGPIWAITVSGDGRRAAVAGADGSVSLRGVSDGAALTTLFATDTGQVLAVTPEGYYTGEHGALEAAAFRVGDRAYPFEQFDVPLNRPDRVLTACGSPDAALARAYARASEERLRRLGVAAEASYAIGSSPDLTISAPPPLSTDRGLVVPFSAAAAAGSGARPLQRLRVTDNGAAIPFSVEGDTFSGAATGPDGCLLPTGSVTCRGRIRLDLGAGENRLAFSVADARGTESLEQTATVQCTAPSAPKLFGLLVGVSVYRDLRYRLNSADADADALAVLFHSEGLPGRIDVLRNQEATAAAIQGEKAVLAEAGPDDTVIVFLAGHGLLDDTGNYYFGAYDVDFDHPAGSGVPYSALLALLADCRARRKLLLIDTCYSGETDPSAGAGIAADTAARAATPGGRGARLASARPTSNDEDAFALEQELFANLDPRSGATVIAAARGNETAGETLKHGIFTACVLDGLRGAADANHDGQILVSELREYVTAEVSRRTGGRQRPITREENVDNDFEVLRIGK